MKHYFTITLIVFAVSAVSIYASVDFQWALVAYHKSGHMLSYQLATAMTRLHLTKYNHNFMTHNENNYDYPETELSQVLHLSQPHLILNWTEWFDMSLTAKPRIVHFCRDPTELALSGYLYHAQNPTPEGWVDFVGLDPCQTNITTLRILANIISPYRLPKESDLDIYEELLKAHALCMSLFAAGVTGAGVDSNRTYGTFLRRAMHHSNETFMEGLRLQAAVNLVSVAVVHMPVLLMAAHSVLESEAWIFSHQHGTRIISKRVLLEDFPIHDQVVFRQRITSMFSFLMAPPKDNTTGFWQGKFSVHEATDASMREIAAGKARDPAHITHLQLNQTMRESYGLRILNDPILGKMYRLCRRLILLKYGARMYDSKYEL